MLDFNRTPDRIIFLWGLTNLGFAITALVFGIVFATGVLLQSTHMIEFFITGLLGGAGLGGVCCWYGLKKMKGSQE